MKSVHIIVPLMAEKAHKELACYSVLVLSEVCFLNHSCIWCLISYLALTWMTVFAIWYCKWLLEARALAHTKCKQLYACYCLDLELVKVCLQRDNLLMITCHSATFWTCYLVIEVVFLKNGPQSFFLKILRI